MSDVAGQDRIREWLQLAKLKGAHHLLVVCDTFSYDDYPVFVLPGQEVREVAKQYDGVNMQKVMEVYAMAMDPEQQLAEHRAWHWD